MSLRVWLPFNSDLGNIGLETDAVTSTSGSIDTTYTVLGNGSKSSASITLKKNYLGYTGSMCFWVYVTPTDTKAVYFGNNNMSAVANNRKWSLFAWETRNDLHSWGCMKDDSTTFNGSWTLYGVVPDNKWTHVAVCHDINKQYVYINGVLKGTYAWDASGNITFDHTVPIPAYSGRYMNDFRIYDHCLSAKEVNEIAKGLLFHAKLDTIGGKPGNPNMLRNSWYLSGVALQFGVATSNTASIEDNGDGTYTRKFVINADPTNWHFTNISQNLFKPKELKPNTKYQFTMWLRTNKSRTFTVRFLNPDATGLISTGQLSFTSTGDSKWHKYTGTLTTISDLSSVSNQIIYIYGLEFTGTYEYKWLKLEEGSESTDWIPNEEDELYNKLGYNNDKIEYSAPYSNNPVANGGISNAVLVNNSVVNERCLKIVNSSSGGLFFSGPWKSGIKLNNCSFSIWASVSVSKGNIFGIGYNTGIRCRVEETSLNSLNSFWVYSQIHNPTATTNPTQTKSINFSIPSLKGDDSMHHYVITWNNGYLTLYFDGVRKSTSDITSLGTQLLLSSYGGVIGSFNGTGEVQPGRFSDLRIYAKTLTDEDVKELYSVREAIDKSGNLYCAEYKEDELSNTGFEKCGIVHSKSLCEIPIYWDYDIYEEPDGSKWIRIFHHNNPASYLFSSSDSMSTDIVYKDVNRWGNTILYETIRKTDGRFEFMIKQQLTSGGTVYKYRWIQEYSPSMGFSYTTNNYVEKNISSGYTKPADKFGGLLTTTLYTTRHSYFVCNDGTNGDWWGALGAWDAYNGGIPGYNSQIITTGFLDLYYRIDDAELYSTYNSFIDRYTDGTIGKTSISKQGTINTKTLIEL